MEPSSTSHRALGIILIVVAAVAIIGGMVWYFLAPTAPATPIGQGGATLPAASSTQTLPGGSGTQLTRTIYGTDGSTVVVNDFIGNGVTLAEPQNPGIYVLQGPTGYCDTSSCPRAGAATDFRVEYDASSTTFNIALTQEPIGQSRLNAEQFLESTLGLQQQALCGLRYYIGTTIGVNDSYAGENLGFSFCPGATKLPTN